MEKEVKDLIEKIQTDLTEVKAMKVAYEELKAAQAKLAPVDEIERLEANAKKATDDFTVKLETLGEQYDQVSLDLKDSKFGPKGECDFAKMKKKWDDKSFVQQIQQKGASTAFEIKTVMDVATYLSGSSGLASAVVLPFREPGVGKAPDRIPTLLDLVSRGNIASDPLTWVERSARTMAAAAVAEAGAYASTFMTYIQYSQAVERIGHYVKVQNKALEDWDLLMAEINTELFTGLERTLEAAVYSGTGSTPVLQGITDTGFAYAYTSTDLTNVVTPNEFDALRAAIMQCKQHEFTNVTAVLVNPAQGAAMDLPKSSEGLYTLPTFVTRNGNQTFVKGVPIYETNLVTAGEFLVGDFTKDLLLMRRGIDIRIFEQNEDDALYDRKTITASLRAVNRIKACDYYAFVYDAFTDVISAIS
jgi:HK97 family phage major capsid protein